MNVNINIMKIFNQYLLYLYLLKVKEKSVHFQSAIFASLRIASALCNNNNQKINMYSIKLQLKKLVIHLQTYFFLRTLEALLTT